VETHALQVDFQQYRTLLEVSESIAAHRDLKALLRELAQRLLSVAQLEFIGLILHEPERNVMRAYYLGTGEAESVTGLEIPVTESASGWVFTTQQVLVVVLDEEPRFPAVKAVLSRWE
jgi:transcriptional regulator with GAF, ATPase, and Fis domain